MEWNKDFSKIEKNKQYLIAERYKNKTYYHIGTPWFTNINYETGEFLEESYLDSFECTDEYIIRIKYIIGFIEIEEPIIF